VIYHGSNNVASPHARARSHAPSHPRKALPCDRGAGLDAVREGFAPLAADFAMDFSFHAMARKTRTLVMVSRFGHCLNDLIYRHRIGALPIEIPLIVSNHRDFEDVAAAANIPFLHLPVTAQTKPAQEARHRRHHAAPVGTGQRQDKSIGGKFIHGFGASIHMARKSFTFVMVGPVIT
jgi:formyltetrahydrofolate deformylase